MATREDLIDQFKTQLDKWNQDLYDLEEKAKNAKEDVKGDINEKIESVKKQKADAQNKLETLKNSSSAAAGDIADGAKNAFSEFRKGLSNAWSHFDSGKSKQIENDD